MIKALTEAITALLPAELGAELKTNIDAVIRSNFDRMELVSREQFEVQEKVLQRTRSRVEELERQVAELEKLVADQATGET